MKERILFATIAAGGAHVSSAEAMAQAIEASYPGRFELTVSDLMLELGFDAFDRRHKEAWRAALKRPWTVRLGQGLSDALPQLSMHLQRRLLDPFAERVAREFGDSPPDLVVANHGWTNTALALAKQRYGLEVPVVTFVGLTVDATAIWLDTWAERYLIGARRGKRILARLGVPEAKIDVIGYPVKQRFLHAPDKAAARRTLGLADRFTCLIALGGEGVGNIPRDLVRWLNELAFPVQLVVIAGRNADLERDLASLALPNLRVEGFVDDMEAYMAASDVLVGKVSSATVGEALAVGRPILATRRSYRSEDEFIRYLESKGWGGLCPDRESLQARVTAYHAHPERLAEVARGTRTLDFGGMSRRIARYLVTYLETRQPSPELVGPGLDWD